MPQEGKSVVADASEITGAELLQLKKQTESNDRINLSCRNQIDDIFKLTNELRDKNKVVEELEIENNVHDEIPTISINMVKNLGVQLNKLKAIDVNNHLNSITKSISNMEKKIDSLQQECLMVKQKIETNQEHGNVKYTNSSNDEAKQINQYQQDIDDLKNRKIRNISRQLHKSELANYKVLKQIVFSKDKFDNLKVFNLPILKLDEFLNYNLIDINQFLEVLIKLQIYLQDLFQINLPYLQDLKNSLPNSKFYDLIKQKTNLMLGKEEDVEDEEDEKTDDVANKGYLISPEPIDKIVKLGNVIKLPLSAKTRNMQRRYSMVQSPEPDIPILKEQSLSPTTSNATNNGSVNVNKKLIIIPHKILNKPFNKLSIKEFLNFLIVIVKIIVNFENFLILIDGNDNTSDTNSFEFICDFNSIMLRINNLKLEDNQQFQKNPNLLNSKLKLKDLTENVYKLIIHGNVKSFKSPTLLQDLNFSDLIENQSKKQQVGDWDMVSRMF